MTTSQKQITLFSVLSLIRFPHLLPYHGPQEHDLLSSEFLEYQTMLMPPLQDPEELEMGGFWAEMATRKHKVRIILNGSSSTFTVAWLNAYDVLKFSSLNLAVHSLKVTGVSQFQRLASIAKLVLVLPHSNADAERVFSVVGLNKTKSRNRLALDGTLSSIMTIKMAGLEPCFKWEPSSTLIKASKMTTSQYNKAHLS